MDHIEKFFGLIAQLYTAPLHQYGYGGYCDGSTDCGRDWLLTLTLGVFIYGITLVVCGIILFVGIRKILKVVHWRRHKAQCQHEVCGHTWTLWVSDGNEPGCIRGVACCSSCHKQHRLAARKRQIDAEPRVQCPTGHGEMAKRDKVVAIIDVCTTCPTVVLTVEELAAIERQAFKKGERRGIKRGQSSGTSTGLVIGWAAGSVINS